MTSYFHGSVCMNAAGTTVRHPAKDDVIQLAFPKNGGPGLPLASNKAQATETPGFPITGNAGLSDVALISTIPLQAPRMSRRWRPVSPIGYGRWTIPLRLSMPHKASRRSAALISRDSGLRFQSESPPSEPRTAAPHSITSSARARIRCGIVSPSAAEVFRLTTSSNRVGCSTGRSAGLAPFRILSTSAAARSKFSWKTCP